MFVYVCLGCIVLQFVRVCIIFKGVVVIIQWYTICEKEFVRNGILFSITFFI